MKKISLLSMIVLLLYSSIAYSSNKDHDEEWNELNRMADQVLQLGKQQKYAESKAVLQQFSNRFLKSISKKQWSIKDIKSIIFTYEQAREAVTKMAMEDDQRIHRLTQFRLAVDALTSNHQPLWHETKRVVMNPLEEAFKAKQAQNKEQFDRSVNDFLVNYDMIRPSLMIDFPETKMEKLKSYVQYIDQQRDDLFKQATSENKLREIIKEFHALYEQNKKDDYAHSLLEVISIVGSIIIVTFIYVGWRKYKGEKELQKLRKRKRREY